MQKRRGAAAREVLTTLLAAFAPESPVRPPAQVPPALLQETLQGGWITSQIRHET